MFVNVRRIRKCQFLQLMTTCFVLSVVMVCWEQIDNSMVSYVKSYSYRYLVNSYNFINKSFAVSREEADSLSRFPYLINHQQRCQGGDVLLLLLVKTAPDNAERRMSIRSTWGNESYAQRVLGATVRVVFVLGIHSHAPERDRVQQELLREDRSFGDLVQQGFLDTFHNLTVKLILQLRWAQAYCPHARFFMSADDDIFVHMPNLVRYLQNVDQSGGQDFWVGHVHRGAPPIRHRDSKYFVPYNMYPWASYPDYTAGAAYVLSGHAVSKIHQASLTLNATIYIDDVFMGICASVAGVSPQEHVYFSGGGKAPYHPCIYSQMITSHGHIPDIHHVWKEATSPEVQKATSGIMGKMYCMAVKIALLCKPYQFNTYPCKAAFL